MQVAAWEAFAARSTSLGVDKSGNKGGQTLGPAVPKGGSDGKVLPLHVAQLMHRIEKRLPLDGPGGVGPNRHEPDRVHFPRLLRLDGERRGEETATDGRNARRFMGYALPASSTRLPRGFGSPHPGSSAHPFAGGG